MPRLLRHSSKSYDTLASNSQHVFAQQHALNIYPSDAIYSFIPKNACSTMRTTLAVANGCIKDVADFNWIHQNNNTFSASLAELAKARYTFTILRCPFSRLLSVYLDKFLDRTPQAWRYVELHKRAIDIEDITFEFFVKSMTRQQIRNSDIHWIPQENFLVYEDYDDFFALEDIPTMAATLKQKIDLDLVDARPLTQHGADGYRRRAVKGAYRKRPFELLKRKQAGTLPTLKSMYSDELVACVKRAYRKDISLYKRKLGTENLSFV